MRTQNDQYKMPNGNIILVNQITQPPKDSRIWNGYDYDNQFWVHNGQEVKNKGVFLKSIGTDFRRKRFS